MAPWKRALVTGASAGIGAEIVRRLAADGVDLVIVARRQDRLEALRAECGGAVSIEILCADLADPVDLERVAERLADVRAPVDLLVNNAGLGGHGLFWERPFAGAEVQIDVNIRALVRLSHAAAGHMVGAGAGTILNVSSVAGNQPGPRSAVYNATKAFVTSFSEALAVEVRGTGVHVTASCPGLTRTEFFRVARHDGTPEAPEGRARALLSMDASTVARDALDAAARGRVVRVHGLGNRWLAVASRVAPPALKRFATGRVVARMDASPTRISGSRGGDVR
jgi:uncharacterized protein